LGNTIKRVAGPLAGGVALAAILEALSIALSSGAH
jgi:hypothetical protein